MKTFRYFLFLLFVSNLLLSSCKKEELSFSKENDAINQRTLCVPTVLNGRLKFDDLASIKCYYHYVSNLVKNDTTDSDSLLLGLESELGHTSLRSTFYDMEGDYIPIANHENRFIGSDVKQMILNPYYEVQIGDKVYIYQTPTKIYMVNASSSASILKFRNVAKGTDLPLGQFDSNMEVEDLDGGLTQRNSPNCPNAGRLSFPNKCLSPKLVNLDLLHFDFFGGLSPFTGTINWGDGNMQNISSLTGGINIPHQYTNNGTFNIEVTMQFVCLGSPVTETLIFKAIIGDNCIRKFTTQEVTIEHGDVRMIGWTTVNADSWSYEIVAKTISQKKIGGKWRDRRSDYINTKVIADFFNNSCNFKDHEEDDDDCTWCRDEVARCRESLNESSWHHTGDVKGKYFMREEGVIFEAESVIVFCN